MLKFSGFAGLTSCLGEARRDARLTQGLLPKDEQKDRAARALDTLLPEKTTQCAACAKGDNTHLDTQACAATPPQKLQGKITGRREHRL